MIHTSRGIHGILFIGLIITCINMTKFQQCEMRKLQKLKKNKHTIKTVINNKCIKTCPGRPVWLSG